MIVLEVVAVDGDVAEANEAGAAVCEFCIGVCEKRFCFVMPWLEARPTLVELPVLVFRDSRLVNVVLVVGGRVLAQWCAIDTVADHLS